MSSIDNQEVFFRLESGFNHPGKYLLDRQPAHEQPLIAYYEHGATFDAPVVILTHGFRGDPNGPNNLKLMEQAKSQGFATISIAHAGFDHYGHDVAPEAKDTGTLLSNVEDVELVLGALHKDRPVIFLANSGSLNVAYAAGRNDERVSHIIGVSPFPDMYDYINLAKKQGEADLAKQGYHVASRFGATCKITQDWLSAGNPVSMSHKVVAMLAPHQPKMSMVRAEADSVVLPTKLPFMKNFKAAFAAAGCEIDDYVTDEKAHEITPAILVGVQEQLAGVARDLEFDPTRHLPALEQQTVLPRRG